MCSTETRYCRNRIEATMLKLVYWLNLIHDREMSSSISSHYKHTFNKLAQVLEWDKHEL